MLTPARWLVCAAISFVGTCGLANETDEALIEASWRVDLQDTLDALPPDKQGELLTKRYMTITAELSVGLQLVGPALDRGNVDAILEALQRRGRRLGTRQLYLLDRMALLQSASALSAEQTAAVEPKLIGALSDALGEAASLHEASVQQARSGLESSGRDSAMQVAFEQEVTRFIGLLQQHRGAEAR